VVTGGAEERPLGPAAATAAGAADADAATVRDTATTSAAPDDAVRVECPVCHAKVLPGERFCEACGSALTGVPAPVAPPPPPPPPRAVGEVARASSVTVPLSRCPSCGELSSMADGYCSICGMRAPAARDHVEASGPGWAGVSDRGQHHARNEDAFKASPQDGTMDPTGSDGRGGSDGPGAEATDRRTPPVIVAVSDGVSTTQRPDDASLACVQAVHRALGGDANDLTAAGAAGRAAVLEIDPTGDRSLGPPSCTVLMAVVDEVTIELGWLGDCRAYWVDGSGVEVLTTDHSWAAEEVAAGRSSEADALADPRAHMITRWVGADADPAWEPATRRFVPPGPGHLVLCSDGLWNYFSDAAALPAAAGALDDLLAAANRLVDFANDAGGHDNITVVIVAWPVTNGAAAAVAAPIALPPVEDPT